MSDYERRISSKKETANSTNKVLQGIKNDQDKPDLTLLPAKAKSDIARAFMYGAKKYGRNNYKKGMKWSRVLAAAERHLDAFKEGEDTDEESGLNHLAHLGACVCMLLHYYNTETGQDDRAVVEELP